MLLLLLLLLFFCRAVVVEPQGFPLLLFHAPCLLLLLGRDTRQVATHHGDFNSVSSVRLDSVSGTAGREG